MDFPFLLLALPEWLANETVWRGLRFALTLLIGLPLLYVISGAAGRFLTKRASAHAGMLAAKGIRYTGVVLLVLTSLRELGWDLTAILGAAGIAGVAIGFASQTSLSNIISGLFLIWEKPFSTGDAIDIGGTVGIVHSIDLLSIKLRTYDNRFVRIPNETLIKSNLTNISRFPIRRCDLQIGTSYNADPEKVMQVLKEVAAANPHCLDDPAPFIGFTGFGESSLNFLFGVWCARTDFGVLRNTILTDVKARFQAEGIEIPFPTRTLFAGQGAAPFPIRIVGESEPVSSGKERKAPDGN